MSSVKLLQDTIAEKQNAINAVQAQIQQARDKEQFDLAEGLQQQLTDHSNQITQLQSDLPKAIEDEKREAEEKARKEQEDKDKGIGVSDFI